MSAGRPKGNAKTRASQVERRRDAVVELSKKGYWPDQIARAIGLGLSTVHNDRLARKQELAEVPRIGINSRRPMPDPAPVDWRSEPARYVPPAYVLSSKILQCESLLEALREANARNRLAFAMEAAAAAGDEEFTVRAQTVLADLEKVISDMADIAGEPAARRAAMLPQARDDLNLPPALSTHGGQKRDLPPPGRGERPGRVYQSLWASAYAGLPLDEETIGAIARNEGNSVERVTIAAAEMRKLFGS